MRNRPLILLLIFVLSAKVENFRYHTTLTFRYFETRFHVLVCFFFTRLTLLYFGGSPPPK